MIDALRRYLSEHLAVATPEASPEQALRLATVALLFEVVRADHVIRDVERDEITRAVTAAFGIDAGETARLIESAETRVEEATSLYEFTRVINTSLDAGEKSRVIELLWRVAWADGDLDKYEEHIIRRIADLIHVPHSEFIRSKLAVVEGGDI